TKHNPALGPAARNRYLALVPSCGDVAQFARIPSRMGIDRLAILLHVVGNAWPASRDLKVTPILKWHLSRLDFGRLPPPQSVETDPLSGSSFLVIRPAKIPDCGYTRRQRCGGLFCAKARI